MAESKDTIGNTGLRVFVDPKRCVSNGKCTYAAPGVYVIDEETGVAYVDDEDRATVENLFAGARACPTDAIILEQYGRRVHPRILAPMPGDDAGGAS
jgi:ferredoxin